MESLLSMKNLVFDVDDPTYCANDLPLREHLLKLKEDTLASLQKLSKKGIKIGSKIRNMKCGCLSKLRFSRGAFLTIGKCKPGCPQAPNGWIVDTIELLT